MSLDAYLLITFLAASVLLISMHPLAWTLWAVLLVTVAARFAGLLIALLR